MTCLRISLFILLVAFTSLVQAQITVTRAERLPLSRSHVWSHPQFSPNGNAVYFTDEDGNGIWEYSLQTRLSRQVASDPKSGFAFNISSDGKSLIYRRTLQGEPSWNRKQDVVLMDLVKRTSAVLASGSDVSIPSFSRNAPVYSLQSRTVGPEKTTDVNEVLILGIENTKITLSLNSIKTMLDPLGNGSYIWPVLSPKKQRIVAYEMDKGAFVCDLRGKVLSRLGRRDSPSWTRSGRWIVYMEDKDDGHRVLTSDLFAVTPDGRTTIQLTTTPGVLEMFPQCSPSENTIVCSTADGAILILDFEERQ